MDIVEQIRAADIKLDRYTTGNHKTLCPQCSHTRRNKRDPCLSVTIEQNGAVWNCHNCQWTGGAREQTDRPIVRRDRVIKRPTIQPESLRITSDVVAWFAVRGISLATLERMKIKTANVWMPGPNCEVGVIAYPYYRGGEVVNVKYRTEDKQFRQEKDAEKILYGMDAVPADAKSLIWVEGENDLLAFHEAGIFNVVSVPDGAPKQARDDVPNPEDDRKYEYVWNCNDWLKRFGAGIDRGNQPSHWPRYLHVGRLARGERCAVQGRQ